MRLPSQHIRPAPGRGRAIAKRALLIAIGVLASGCGNSSMRLDGDLKTTLAFAEPIQIQLRGPTIQYEGVYVSEKILERVEPGKTRTDWLLAVLGEPTSRSPLEDGSEIWKWCYRPVEQEASFVQIMGGGDGEPSLHPVSSYVHVRNGVAIEKWSD